jgi:hypothetical protein
MKSAKLIPPLVVSLASLSYGCSSLRPPAKDSAVWMQQQEIADKADAQEKDPANLLYYLGYGLGSVLAH